MSADMAVDIIAHRGESYDAPENTLASFRLAWQRGSRTVETDVRLTSDGRPILCHDADTARTTGVHMVIAETPFDELRKLDAGRWKGDQWAGERLPALEEALASVPDHGRLWIEVKSGTATLPPLVETVRASGLHLDQIAVISFDDEVVRQAGVLLPGVSTYLISAFRRGTERGQWSPTIPELIERARAARARGINVHFIGPVSTRTVRMAHESGLELGVWTVDAPEIARRMLRAGVDTITSNRAAWLRNALGFQ